MSLCFSLRTKIGITVFLLVSGILCIGGFTMLGHFEQHLKTSISEQQFALISKIAENIDDQISLAQSMIVGIAAGVPPELLRNPDEAQSFLDRHSNSATSVFDNGIFLFSATGLLIAESPFIDERRGKNFSFREYFQQTVATDQPYISIPYFSSQKHGHPALNFTAPIHDTRGKLTGILVGSLDLTRDNMLGRLSKTAIGKTGYLYLYNTDRLMIMHPVTERILKHDVPVGANLLYDQAIKGFEGSGETVNSKGLHALASFKRLHNVDWILAANYPTAEAYAPIYNARVYFILGMILALLLSTLVVWLTMRWLTTPLLHFIVHVEDISASHDYHAPITVKTRDEIASLANAFNRLMREIQEQKLLAQEQLLFQQTLIDTIPNPIYYKDTTGHYLGCNRAFEKLYNRTQQQIIGHTIDDFAPEEMAKSLGEFDRELFAQKSGQFQIFECSIPFADGTTHDALFYKAIFSDSDGAPAGLVGTIIDITQRKATEVALARQREFSENLLQNSAVPCFVIDSDHTVLLWTRACEELTGISVGEVLGTDQHWKAFYPDQRPCLADVVIDGNLEETIDLYTNFANSPLTSEGLQAEGWFNDIGGKRRYLRFDAAPIRDNSGTLIAAIETFADLTSQKQIEQALRESELSYSSLIERSPDAILVHRQGQVVFANQSAAQLFAAQTPAEMTGNQIMDWVHPDYRDLVKQRINDVETTHVEMPYIEEKVLRRDGSSVDVEAGSTPVFYKGEWSVQTILRDITDRKEMQERIWRQANFDALTDVPNRLMFLDRLQQALENANREQHRVALMFIDLDHFKKVNDTLGHEAGDSLLRQVAQRLTNSLRKTDTLARIGGDEFTIILPKVTDPPTVHIVVNRILQALVQPFDLPGGTGHISGSIGVAFFPDNGKDVTTLIKSADAAMYQAKEAGRNGARFAIQPEELPVLEPEPPRRPAT